MNRSAKRWSLLAGALVLFGPLGVLAPPATATGANGDAAALERALETIRADRILADVSYVACDEMGGRDTPSTGQRLTARFLRNRLQRLGWKPGAKEGWFFEYPLLFKRLKEPDTRAVATILKDPKSTDPEGGTKLELTFGTDYFFSSRDLDNTDVTGSVVFVGAGSKEELAAADVKGKWLLCLDGENAKDIDARALAAGAVGVLITPDVDGKRDYVKEFGRWLGSMRRGRVQVPDEEGSPVELRSPKVYLTPPAAQKLLALAGMASIADPTPGEQLGITFTDTRRMHGDGKVQCEDVCAFWPGSDPELSKEVLIVSAHYDHLGTTSEGVVFNGADDNGSGTCGLLALAEVLADFGPLRRSVMLIWVSGEEKGLLGSGAWCKAPWFPNDGKAVADINIDMIGRNDPHQILITPTKAHKAYNGLVKLAEELAPSEAFTEIKSADDYYMRSDHAKFARLGIPVTFLFADVHADYHEPTDDPEKIDSDKIRRVVRLVMRMLDRLQGDKLELTE